MTVLLPGTQVEARGLPWEIVHAEPAGEQQRLRLRCVQGDIRGMEVDILHPFEEVRAVSREFEPRQAGRLRQWRLYHDAFLLEQALGPSALLVAQPGRLDIAPYQLVPVMRALRMSRVRLLLADGVGLGKTVEAGLVMAELIARRRAHRILVVSPAGPLLEQWHRELNDRFGLRFEKIKSGSDLQELRRSLVLGANPFDQVSYCLTSIDFAKQEKVLQELERCVWDLVVIDEAHHCVRLGSAGDWEDSRRRRIAEVLARQADALLLLTATPHDGFDTHFASLVELLDPSLVDGRGALRGERYRQHVVRRIKEHIKDPNTGEPLFKKRQVTPVPVTFDKSTQGAFATFQQAILAAVAPRLRQAVRKRRYGEVLAFVTLLKRSVSTVAACRNTLRVIRDRYDDLLNSTSRDAETRRQRLRTLRDYQLRLERFGALSFEEEQDRAALEAEDMAAEFAVTGLDEITDRIDELRKASRRDQSHGKRVTTTRDALNALVEMAEEASESDPKLPVIFDSLRNIRALEPQANVLIYTEYADSQDVIVEYLTAAVERAELNGEILSISGRAEYAQDRGKITDRFATEDGIVLVSTDATAEGLNLQDRCHHLIHVELPYNPNRLEQRNGRIDRYGQREVPQVRYLYLAGTFEERLLLRLVAKYERQRARLTFVPDTLGGITTDEAQTVRLLEGLGDEETTLFARPSREIRHIESDENDDVTTPAYRELLAEVERAMTGYEKTAKTSAWLGEAGLNAEARLVSEASRARDDGQRLGAVELTRFVVNALEDDRDASNPIQRWPEMPDLIEMHLPPSWIHGMNDIPGYDDATHTLRITTDPGRLRDKEKRRLGYLGRAHPVVRRALDRVRNIRYGEKDAFIDRRVSAIQMDIEQPALVCTFLGIVESNRGHEFERVLAVQVNAMGAVELFEEPEQWLSLLELGRTISTRGLWDRHFTNWGDNARATALDRARVAFSHISTPQISEHQLLLGAEKAELDSWLSARADDLCGLVQLVQSDLFSDASMPPTWRTEADATSRLASFAIDTVNSPASRREADGVLLLYKKRAHELESRAQTHVLEPQPLGLLMLVPCGGEEG